MLNKLNREGANRLGNQHITLKTRETEQDNIFQPLREDASKGDLEMFHHSN